MITFQPIKMTTNVKPLKRAAMILFPTIPYRSPNTKGHGTLKKSNTLIFSDLHATLLLHMRRKIWNQNENDFHASRAGATLIYFPAIFSCFTIQSGDLLCTRPVFAKLCHAIVHFRVRYDRWIKWHCFSSWCTVHVHKPVLLLISVIICKSLLQRLKYI